MSGDRNDSRSSVVLGIVLIALALLGWFVLAGQPDQTALAVGAVVAVVGGGFFGVIGSRLPLRIAFGLAVGLTLMGLLFLHLLSSEYYFDYGAATASVRAVTYVISGLMFGLAARAVVLALLRRQRP